ERVEVGSKVAPAADHVRRSGGGGLFHIRYNATPFAEMSMEPEAEIFGALTTGRIDRVRELLDERPDLINARNESGDSLLLAAAYTGHRDLFELLLAKGAGVSLFQAAAVALSERVH